MKKLFTILTSVLLTGVFSTAANDILTHYPFCKTVTDDAVAGQLPAIRLDSGIYRQLNFNCSNLRVADKDNKPIPFVYGQLCKYAQSNVYSEVPGKIVDFTFDPQQNEAIIVYGITGKSASEKLRLGKLEIDPKSNRPFNKNLTLEFDNGHTEQQKFFNHTGRVDFSRHSFTFEPQSSRKITLRIKPFAEQHSSGSVLEHSGRQDSFTEKRIFSEELNIDRIAFFAVKQEISPVGVQNSKLQDIEIKKLDLQPKQSNWEFKLFRQPVSSFHLKSSTENYRRTYLLEFFREEEKSKTLLACYAGELAPDFKFPDLKNIRPDSAALTIFNNDNAELENCTFEFRAPVEALLLDPKNRNRGPFTVYYGGSNTNSADYDLKSYIHKFAGQSYAVLTLGSQQLNPSYSVKSAAEWQSVLQKLLPYLIGTAVLLLGLFSIRMLKKINVETQQEE